MAINECLLALCKGGFDALPYADSDIIGIGVFASYLIQLILVIILWLGLVARAVRRRTNGTNKPAAVTSGGQAARNGWLDFLFEIHKAQCYFAGALLIAILASDIVDANVAMAILLLPLTINGIVPVAFAGANGACAEEEI
ncbi:hypothetical protein KHU50_004160 [Colletotrichum sp. SAR 10_65]|nr:hypothetical protein K4K51_006331 [Colletotrichum sp. SAR 10_75]KAI8203214.1 hypothetical protein KHU50_004160 [Colletotrichum sp. SAR 10_65]